MRYIGGGGGHDAIRTVTGAQPEIFQGRGGFLELGTSINISPEGQEKNAAGKASNNFLRKYSQNLMLN